MFCSINKWIISRSVDTGRPLPGRVKNHLQRCNSCREFAAFCTSIRPKLIQDKNIILEKADKALTKKILSGIPVDITEKTGLENKTRFRKRAPRRPVLIPSLSAALVVLGILGGILFFTHPRPQDTNPLGQLSALVKAASPEDVLSRIESPLETEYEELKRALDSTTRFLLSSLDFRLGQ